MRLSCQIRELLPYIWLYVEADIRGKTSTPALERVDGSSTRKGYIQHFNAVRTVI
ncbi:hypothetical protein C8R44DRAFT_791647, partial [Mycena epipterygia]